MHWSATLYIIEEQYVVVQLSDWIPKKKGNYKFVYICFNMKWEPRDEEIYAKTIIAVEQHNLMKL